MRIIFVILLVSFGYIYGIAQQTPFLQRSVSISTNWGNNVNNKEKSSLRGQIIDIETREGVYNMTIKVQDAQSTLTNREGMFYFIFHSKVKGNRVILKIIDDQFVIINPRELNVNIPSDPDNQIHIIYVCAKEKYEYYRKTYKLFIYGRN